MESNGHKELYVIESNPTMAKYDKVIIPMSKADVAATKKEFPELIIRPATEEEKATCEMEGL